MVDSDSNDDILMLRLTRSRRFSRDSSLSRPDFTYQQQIPTTMHHNRDGTHEGLDLSLHLRPIGNNEAPESTKQYDLDGDEMMEQSQESSEERSTGSKASIKEKKVIAKA